MICKVEAQVLYGRVTDIREMVRPLVRGDSSCRRLNERDRDGRPCIVLASFSGPQPPSDAFRDWRFATAVTNLWGSYFERWVPVDVKGRHYFLDRAYLHLYRRTRIEDANDREILGLHCDPNEPNEPSNYDGPKHARYKRGPHIHVSTAEQPMPHSHIALDLGQLPEVLGSFENLSSAIRSAIRMLDDQVIALYRSAEA
jgi:hypothetical protein